MTDPTNHDDADRAWFRSQVDPVVDAEPVADAWPAIATRSQGESPAPPPVAAGRWASPRTRWLAAAAVVVVLAAVAGLVVSRRDSGHDAVTTGPSTDAPGWYIPKDLPTGWTLVKGLADHGTYCENSQKEWRRPAGEGVTAGTLQLRLDACIAPQPALEGDPGPALGHGFSSSTFTTGDIVLSGLPTVAADAQLVWRSGQTTWSLTGKGVTREQLVAAAESIVADPASIEAPLAGFEDGGGGSGSGVQPDRGDGVVAHLALHTPEGWLVSYDLYPSGQGVLTSPVGVEEPYPLSKQPNPLVRRDVALLRSEGITISGGGSLVGQWPDADVRIGLWVAPGQGQIDENGHGPDISAKDKQRVLNDLAESLRPATTEEWRAFLRTSDQASDEALLRATSLDGLAGSTSTATTATTTTTAPAATTTTEPVTTTSVDAPADTTTSVDPSGQTTILRSPPGVASPSERPSKMYSSLDGLEFRLELPNEPIRADAPPLGTLVITNTTDDDRSLNECTQGLTQWGLVESDVPGAKPAGHNIIDCYDTPMLTVKAGRTERFPMDWALDNAFRAQRIAGDGTAWAHGTLDGGTYRAVVEIPGATTDVRIELMVTVADPPCPTSDEVAARYVGLSPSAARARAERDGIDLRVTRIDGKDQALLADLRCDRIGIEVRGDQVISVLRG